MFSSSLARPPTNMTTRSGKRTNNTIIRKSLRIQAKLQKKNAEHDLDVKRYQELLKKNLENDIPPKRVKGKKKASGKPDDQNVLAPLMLPQRPKFTSTQKANEEIKSNYSNTDALPPSLMQARTKSFENRVQLQYTYPELIKLINDNLSRNTIDISLVHNFAPKNLELEQQRFAIPSNFYKQTNYSSSITDEIEFFFCETIKNELPLV